MLQLEFEKVPATFESFNPRVEKDGPDKIPAADLKVSVNTDADVLAYFSPMLKWFYFDENGPHDLADGLPLRDNHAVYPHSRDEEMIGATVSIDFGVGTPMIFQGVKVNQFKITPMPGGSVVLAFRIQCRPSEVQAGKLYLLQETGISLTIEPVELPNIERSAA